MSDTKDLFVGVDVGTTGTKTTVIDSTGAEHGTASVSYRLTSPEPRHFVQDAREWLQAVAQTVRSATGGIHVDRIAAVALSVQGGTLIPVDSAGRPLADARSWMDQRAVEDARNLASIIGDGAFLDSTGWPIGPFNTCAQLGALRREEPGVFATAARFCDTAAYVTQWLVGEAYLDRNAAGITQLVDISTGDWFQPALHALGVEADRLPRLCDSGTALGHLAREAAIEMGLPPATLVVAGGHDQYCAALGAGVGVGDMLLSCGTSWVTLGIDNTLRPSRPRAIAVGPHLLNGTWGYFGEVSNGGASLEWARRLLALEGEPLSFAAIEAFVSAAGSKMGDPIYLPDVSLDAGRTSGALLGLRSAEEPGRVLRGVMAGVVAAATRLIDTYRQFSGSGTGITMVGGATRSPTWIQMVAEAMGQQIHVSRSPDVAAIGAAMLAAAGNGTWPSIEAASKAMRARTRTALATSRESAEWAMLRARYDDALTRLQEQHDV